MVGDPIEKRYFNVDEHTGLIRTIGGFNQLINNTVFGFDIRATDRAGAPDGRSAITNVFVSFVFTIIYKTIVLILIIFLKGVYFGRSKNNYIGVG